MTPAQFQAAALEIYQNYWRIKAANALYRLSPIAATERLDYTNFPAVGIATISVTSESVADAIAATNDFITRRLRRDLLLALIAEFESRLSACLISLGAPSEGTLGDLQREIQSRIPLPLVLKHDMDEVRVRRNVMIHHGDLADSKYVRASVAVQPRASPYVTNAAIGDNVAPTDIYLAYTVDVLVRYSNAIG
jgi:hypothetical protein